jgi:single-stranded-DNA-specific exonuclease
MSGLFVHFGGHRQAVGVTLPSAQVGELRRRLNALALSLLTDDDLAPTLEIDAVMELADLTESSVPEALSLAPFGFGNPTPVFALFDAEIAGAPSVLKEKHLRFVVRQQGRSLPVVAWNFAARQDEVTKSARIDLAFCFEQDTYSSQRGLPGWRAVVRDLRASTGCNGLAAGAAMP